MYQVVLKPLEIGRMTGSPSGGRGLDSHPQIMVRAFGDHEHDGDHDFFFSDEDNAQVNVMVSTHGEGHAWVSRDDGDVRVFVTPDSEGGAHARRIWLHADGTTLRCPLSKPTWCETSCVTSRR